jgi:uncharacterized protein (TIGR00369 family)
MADYAAYLKCLQAGEIELNPFLAFLAMKPEEFREGYARFRMTIRPEYMQDAGIMQGGLIVAMADETAAHAIMTLLKPGEGLTTIELKNSFLAPAKDGDLIAEAQVYKKGRTLMIADCTVTDDQARPVVRLSATFMIMRE